MEGGYASIGLKKPKVKQVFAEATQYRHHVVQVDIIGHLIVFPEDLLEHR